MLAYITLIDIDLAKDIIYEMTVNRYIDRNGALTDKYYEAKKADIIVLPESLNGFEDAILNILDKIYDPNANTPEDGFRSKPHLEINNEALNKKEFKGLWSV